MIEDLNLSMTWLVSMLKQYNIRVFGLPYTPENQGAVERVNGSLKSKIFINGLMYYHVGIEL